MYLAHISVTNFRQFGDDEQRADIELNKGITALVGRNDCGKSAIIDAIRYALSTRDQEFVRLRPDDFHIDESGAESSEIIIKCELRDLDDREKGAFAEYLSYDATGVHLSIHFAAKKLDDSVGSRRWVDVTVRSGINGAGPPLDSSVRELLAIAYLRPLRDAEREMSPGRGSRLSQILSNVKEVSSGDAFDVTAPPRDADAIGKLSLLGLSDLLRYSVQRHPGIEGSQQEINDHYLSFLSLAGDRLKSRIDIIEGGTDKVRLRQILERLELGLLDAVTDSPRGRFGLGSNNLLYIACELLLLGREPDGLPLLLVEEPEAHLHPQRQLRLMDFLTRAAAANAQASTRPVQVVLSTHSPNLASKIPLPNVVLVEGNCGFSMAQGETKLSADDYRFLERFLDVTKANLFFAHGVLVVEGDAEALLLPTIANMLGLNFIDHGVSIVNVGGKGLRRFAAIFQRAKGKQTIAIPVACLADFDILPDCAPAALGLLDRNNQLPPRASRRWRTRADFGPDRASQDTALTEHRTKMLSGDGQPVKTFVSDQWTLEYDLAFGGLAEDVYVAAMLAMADGHILAGKKRRTEVESNARATFKGLEQQAKGDREVLSCNIYRFFHSGSVSKTIAAQYLAELLQDAFRSGRFDAETFDKVLPKYIVEAIRHVVKNDGQSARSTS